MLCVQLPTYVDDVALPAFAHRKPRCCASCSNRSICSRDVATATNFCLFNPHIFSSQCVINSVQSSTTRSTVVSVIRLLLITPIAYTVERTLTLWERTFPPGHFPIVHFPDTRVRRDTTRSAIAALDAREPLTSAINNN